MNIYGQEQLMTEWSHPIDHDGLGCPVRGQEVQVEYCDGMTIEWPSAGDYPGNFGDGWTWATTHPLGRIHRYRLRKPMKLLALESIPDKELVNV
jgi:hypothetical protein